MISFVSLKVPHFLMLRDLRALSKRGYESLHLWLACSAEESSSIQTKGRRTLRASQPKVDQIHAEDGDALLLRAQLSRGQSGLPVRGRRQHRRSNVTALHRTKDKGLSTCHIYIVTNLNCCINFACSKVCDHCGLRWYFLDVTHVTFTVQGVTIFYWV